MKSVVKDLYCIDDEEGGGMEDEKLWTKAKDRN